VESSLAPLRNRVDFEEWMVDAARVAAIMHCVVACACLCSRMWMGNLWWCDDNLVFVIAVRDLDCRFLNARHVFVIILYSAASGHDIHFPPFPCHFLRSTKEISKVVTPNHYREACLEVEENGEALGNEGIEVGMT
jgi:hypothetical protein